MNDILTSNLNETINNIKNNNNVYNAGRITKVTNYYAEATGLNNVFLYEEININDKASGYIFKIYPNKIIIALTKINEPIVPGDMAYALKKEFKCLFSLNSIGKIIDVFGNDLLNDKKFDNLVELSIVSSPLPLADKKLITRELSTGITGIDLLNPIGKGQRQLIIGGAKTGKTQICLDTIVNQKDKNVLCIYAAIGKTKKEVKDIYYELTKRGASSYTIIIAAFNDELPTKIYLTPYIALSIASSFMLQTYDVLVCLDDLNNHVEISNYDKKIRETYPYEYNSLLEKGCQHKNGGSITILPVVEKSNKNVFPNIASICDGQIVLSEKEFLKGEKPAINYGLSVSSLNIQDSEIKKLGNSVKRKLLSYLDIKKIYELSNTNEINEELQKRINDGQKIVETLKQYKFSPKTKQEIIESFNFLSEIKK